MKRDVGSIVDHLGSLVAEGLRLAGSTKTSEYGGGDYVDGENKVALHAWLAQTKNIVATVFGPDSQHFAHLGVLTKNYVDSSSEIRAVVGLLEGCRKDLKGGYLSRQVTLISAALFDDVLEEAKHLSDAGHKDPAAVLGRVVLEDALRRIAAEHSVDPSGKASAVNEGLKTAGVYAKPQWRLVQAWLDLGNAAAHGQFDDYDASEVDRTLSDIRRFMAQFLA